MANILIKNVDISFPLYGLRSRSLKATVTKVALGGVLAIKNSEAEVMSLNNINFHAENSERIGIIGDNGSGKTTFLKMVAGIYEPTNGEVFVEGSIMSMLSIFLGIDMETSGLENIIMRCRIMGLNRNEVTDTIKDIIDFSEIGNYINFPMKTYSSGMAMRLAFSIATSIKSDIILMDEWLSVGDNDFIIKAKNRLRKIVDNAKIVLIASHDHNLIKEQCTRILTLSHGKIISDERNYEYQ